MPGFGFSFGFRRQRGTSLAPPEPTLNLSSTSIAESAASGSVVGALSVANGSGSYTFTITADPDTKFAIDGSNLETAAALDYEADTSHLVTIEADNGVDAPISPQFMITVTNALEVTLNALALDDTSVPEDEAATINITGASSGSTITVHSGVLPAGMTLNSGARTIAGTPTTVETANFTLRETHADGSNSPRDTALTIVISGTAPSFTPSMDFSDARNSQLLALLEEF